MAKTFVKIEPYTAVNTTFDRLLLMVSHNSYRKTMDIEIAPVHFTDFGYERVFDWQHDPLSAGVLAASLPMPRKNQKRIDAAQADLNGMADRIAALWNKRDFAGIKALFS